jgi:hypothetical protein
MIEYGLPIAFALPGNTREVVTPPAIAKGYASSCVFNAGFRSLVSNELDAYISSHNL